MIGGDNQEQDSEAGERPIAGLKPSHFVEGDGADCSDDEQDETPAGECGARGSGLGDHAVDFLDQTYQ